MPRHLDDRLALRFPGLYRRLVRGVMALPPGSALRCRALERMISRGFESFSRGDVEVALLTADPEVEIRTIGWEALGLSAHYHGHEGWRGLARDWLAEWGDYEQVPEQLIDLGGRLILRTKATARGDHSGARVGLGVCYCFYLTGGRITGWDVVPSWSDLVEELGLGPGSEIAADCRFVPVMTFREGKIVRVDRYDDWGAAAAAMGLSSNETPAAHEER
jgi:ketosteroid isomerase-like protein